MKIFKMKNLSFTITICISFLISCSVCFSSESQANYLRDRAQLIQEEKLSYFNASTKLNSAEQKVNVLLDQLRMKEIKASERFLPAQHNFRLAKSYIDQNSQILNILRKMPKGGILHIHALGDTSELIKRATYRDDCYINVNQNSVETQYRSYHFAVSGKLPSDGDAIWMNVNQLRSEAKDVQEFDNKLYEDLQFYSPTEYDCNGDCISEDDMWVDFDSTLGRIGSMLAFLPVFKENVLYAMQKLVEDNIQYFELRAIFFTMYDDKGNEYNGEEVLKIWLSTLDEFNSKSEKKLKMKFIYSNVRKLSTKTIYEQMLDCIALRAKYPDYIIGYDLVDEEDRYNSLYYYLDDFLRIQEKLSKNNQSALKFFFHAGETDWSNRYNLYDAFLLNATRIGHGFALAKYPKLMDLARDRKVAIEICPISNQMLLLFADMRTHPAVTFMHHGIPIVISPDDPIIYDYHGVTYDYYEAYMSWDLDVSSLKQISQNSILYSGMTEAEQQIALIEWGKNWDQWVSNITQQFIR